MSTGLLYIRIYLDYLLLCSVDAGLRYAFRQDAEAKCPKKVRAIAISFVDLPVKLWTISSKVRNALVHALHGNGGGSRATTRKRKEKAKSATDLASFDLSQLMQLFQAISKLLELLQGRDGGNLLQQFLKLGFPSDKKKDDKEGITKKKKKKHDGGGGKSLSKTTTKQVTLDKSKTPDKVQQSQGAPMVKRKPTFAEVVAAKPTGFVPVWQLRSSDWNGQVITLEGMANELEKEGNVTATVQVDSEEQLGELRMLLEGDSESKSRELNVTAVLLAPRDPSRFMAGSFVSFQAKLVPKSSPDRPSLCRLLERDLL